MPYKDKKKAAERQRKIRQNKKKIDKKLNALWEYTKKRKPEFLKEFEEDYVEEEEEADDHGQKRSYQEMNGDDESQVDVAGRKDLIKIKIEMTDGNI